MAFIPNHGRYRWLSVAMLTLVLFVVPVVLAVLQVTTFERGESIAWLAIGPLLASLMLTWRSVLAVSGYTVLVALVLVVVHPRPSPSADVVRMVVVVALGSFAVVNCLIRERREARLLHLTEIARVAQAAILQPVPNRVGRWEIASRYHSSAEAAEIGGDLLEVLPRPGGVRVMIGDVRGKGLPAVRLAAAALACFREAGARSDLTLSEVSRQVDQAVLRRAGDEDFVTAVFIDLDDDGTLRMINCGHPAPLRLTPAGQWLPLAPKVATSPLALGPALRTDSHRIAPGDRLLVFTDGLVEARDTAGEFFPLRECADLLDAVDPESALDALVEALERHVGGKLDDDVALLLVSGGGVGDGSGQRQL